MKQSFWIVNAVLFGLFVCVILFISFSKVKISSRKSIVPEAIPLQEETIEKMDTSFIYKNDLFGTYKPIEIIPEEIKIPEIKMPAAPEFVKAEIPEADRPNFLEPLPLTLTGIIIIDDESNNQAIIMDNKTKKQTNYRLGDEIEDSQLARIFKDKIILIRSNGQQEVLYLRANDAKEDNPLEKKNWKNIVKKTEEYEYLIDYDKFIENVKSLSSFSELLNLTSAYKDGKNVGVKVGLLEPAGLGIELGLQPGDIIQKIDGIDVDETEKRYQVYEKIICKNDQEETKVEILRNGTMHTLTYKLATHKDMIIQSEITPRTVNEEQIIKEKIQVLKEKHAFAPTYKEIKSQERSKLFKKMADYKSNDVNNLK